MDIDQTQLPLIFAITANSIDIVTRDGKSIIMGNGMNHSSALMKEHYR